MQAAVDAAVSGDTIDVVSSGYSTLESVTVRTSDLSIVGVGGEAWIDAANSANGKPALILDGASHVTVSNLMLQASGAPAVQVVNSTGVTFDSDYVFTYASPAGALTVDGLSSKVTVSRTGLDVGTLPMGSGGISIASGASGITIADDILAATGVSATGVNGLTVTGNTIQRGCASGVDVEGTSTGVYVENNLLEDANPSTDYMLRGYQSYCVANGKPWAPDVTVSLGSSAGTTADYNDFYVYGSDATSPYSWAGTAYPTLAAFQSGTSEGAHDTADPTQATQDCPRNYTNVCADMWLTAGSPADASANLSAPGALSSDFNGYSPYTSRGALQYASEDPDLALSLSALDTSAYGIQLSSSVTSGSITAQVPLTVSITWGDGTTASEPASSLGGARDVSHTYARLGTYVVTVSVTDNHGNSATNSLSLETAGSDYTAYGPVRLLDTRYGTGAPKAEVQPHTSSRLRVAGNGSIPPSVTAAVLNVTVTDATSAGYITAYGDGFARPTASNLNFVTGQTVPNLVVVPVGADGYVDLYNGGSGSVDLIADIAGYFTQSSSSGYTSLDPARLVDTRNGTGVAKGQVTGDTSIAVQVSGGDLGSLPVSGITAVALNVTVTGPQGSGFLTVYPDGEKTPVVSNINYRTGQTIANAVVAPVGSDGKIRIYNGSGKSTDIVADVVGYYSAGGQSAYLPISPTRFLDTRSSSWGGGPLPSGDYIYMPLGVNPPGITGYVLNVTVTDTKGTGYLTVSPDPNSETQYQDHTAVWPTRPLVSTLNWLHGETVPNLVQTGSGANGITDLWNSGTGSIDLVVDGLGFYQND
ncbi:right-handed parallel beta-helix repeat-containing protein [Streptacidiphilus sp. MAP12-16]|uniref:right-handed parallel beta-helix repeat-containing protein n=1 Tax=Streptacidiphilus sp. MAP12-16 TaxID=3156300 RepID=UPI0035116002